MILVSNPRVATHTLKYLQECVESNWLSGEGPFVGRFEEAFAQRMEVKHALSTNSGTAALHLAMLCLGVGPGDEVILPASTMGACYFAILYCGATPVPVDVEPDIFTISPAAVKAAITTRTKAILAVHLFGHPCEMDALVKIAEQHRIPLIEDCAEAHGASYHGRPVGSFGVMATYSFYANKIITTGEGGMLTTNDPALAQHARSLKTFSFSAEKRFTHTELGYRYTMTNIQAAVGLAQLEELELALEAKQRMATFYQQHLSEIAGLQLPTERPNCRNVYWMYAVLVDQGRFGHSRDELMKILLDEFQIQTRTFFFPPQVAFAEMKLFEGMHFPVADRIGRDGLYLPSGVGTTEAELHAVVDALKQISSAR